MAKLNPVAKKWVKALRSGEFKQTRGNLAGTRGGRCCLGVLCDLAVKAKVVKSYEPTGATPPSEVIKWAGLSTVWGDYKSKQGKKRDLAMDNDTSKKSFAKIADIIESQPEGLFS